MKFGHSAGILSGLPYDVDVSRMDDAWILQGEGGDIEPGQIVGRFDPLAFARLLAKIGHCLAVVALGKDGFKPLALDFVLGRRPNLSYLVGGNSVDEPSSDLHWLRLRGHMLLPEQRYFAVAHIRLFAALGAPTYHAVVGEVSSKCWLFCGSAA